MFAFLTPATVLGAGVLATWNRPAGAAVYDTAAILVVGLAARYATVGLRASAAVVHATDRSLEDAAAALGAGWGRCMAGLVLPLHRRGLAGAALLAFVFAMRDLDAVAVFYPPGHETLPVRIFTLEANGPPATVAGLALLHAAATAAAIALVGAWIGRRA